MNRFHASTLRQGSRRSIMIQIVTLLSKVFNVYVGYEPYFGYEPLCSHCASTAEDFAAVGVIRSFRTNHLDYARHVPCPKASIRVEVPKPNFSPFARSTNQSPSASPHTTFLCRQAYVIPMRFLLCMAEAFTNTHLPETARRRGDSPGFRRSFLQMFPEHVCSGRSTSPSTIPKTIRARSPSSSRST